MGQQNLNQHIEIAKISPNWALRSGAINTLYSALARPLPKILGRDSFNRKILKENQAAAPLYLDFLERGHDTLVLVAHGLESSSYSTSVQQFIHWLKPHNVDFLALNFRGCADNIDPNDFAFYHSGMSQDIERILKSEFVERYRKIVLVGFSMGGNILLKYLGENGMSVDPRIVQTFAFSAPIHLGQCATSLDRLKNIHYARWFLKTLKHKVIHNRSLWSHLSIDTNRIKRTRRIREFDEHFTATYFNYDSADHYYEANSSIFYLSKIQSPAWLINTIDDPFFQDLDYSIVPNNPNLKFKLIPYGGHLGFSQKFGRHPNWMEGFVSDWLNSIN